MKSPSESLSLSLLVSIVIIDGFVVVSAVASVESSHFDLKDQMKHAHMRSTGSMYIVSS